jgi:DNA topoisomerase IB
VLATVEDVAHRFANTRDIARASYINPRVIAHYPESSVVAYCGERLGGHRRGAGRLDRRQGGPLLDLLNRRLRRDLEKAA